MQLTRTTAIRIIKFSGILVLAGIILVYALFRSMDYIKGPQIKIFWPENGTYATTSIISIRGQAIRINKLTLNGNSISTDEQGNWSQTIIIFPGINKILVLAQDQFNRNTQVSLDIFGTSDLPIKTSDINNY